jgi:repressor LexA
MKDAGILDGDLVVVRPTKDAPNGSVVVARIEDEATNEPMATVKTLYKEANRVRLQPANDAYQPIYTTVAQLEGQVVAVVRLLR